MCYFAFLTVVGIMIIATFVDVACYRTFISGLNTFCMNLNNRLCMLESILLLLLYTCLIKFMFLSECIVPDSLRNLLLLLHLPRLIALSWVTCVLAIHPMFHVGTGAMHHRIIHVL